MSEKVKKERTECEVYSRVVGYLRPVGQWNRGKQQEFSDRKTFKKTSSNKIIEVCK
jgi:ribonucleoside-triphosphate reductase